MNEATTPAPGGATKSMTSRRATAPAINVEQLAAKVYQLMLEDARLARARGDAYRARK